METAASQQERRFVLVTGHGTGHQIKSFATEAEARAAFIAARLRTSPRTEWAELVTIDSRARPVRLCWFGANPGVAPAVVVVPATRRLWWRRGAA